MPNTSTSASRRSFMRFLAAGLQSGQKKALVGGTMAANPLSSAAGYFTICEMEKQKSCEKAGAAADRLTDGLKKIIEKYSLPFVAFNQGAICHLETGAALMLDIDIKRFWTIGKTIKDARFRKILILSKLCRCGIHLYTIVVYPIRKKGFPLIHQK